MTLKTFTLTFIAVVVMLTAYITTAPSEPAVRENRTPQIIPLATSNPVALAGGLENTALPKPKLEALGGGVEPIDQDKAKLWANRIDEFILKVNSPLKGYGQTFVDIALKYGYHPYTAVAIAQADSSLGKNLTTPFNIGNVGNTDSCPTCGNKIKSWEQGIEAIYQTLSNRYLSKATKLCHLSRGGWQHCPEGSGVNGGKFYASSKANWHRNATWAWGQLDNQANNNQIEIKL